MSKRKRSQGKDLAPLGDPHDTQAREWDGLERYPFVIQGGPPGSIGIAYMTDDEAHEKNLAATWMGYEWVPMITPLTGLTLEELATYVRFPLELWHLNRVAVARRIWVAGLVPGSVFCSGHWVGPVGKGSKVARLPVVPHAWMKYPARSGESGAFVVDPVRWVFSASGEGRYTWAGVDRDGWYAERAQMYTDPPQYVPNA